MKVPESELEDICVDCQCASHRPSQPCNSDFWINNCNFEIVYDLSKRMSLQVTAMTVNDLPTELLSQIFSYCSVIDLLSVQSVCHKWNDIVLSDKSLWNHLVFSAVDYDVKTTISFLKLMPLLRSVEACVVRNAADMTLLVDALCTSCLDLRTLHFPATCEAFPSSKDLSSLGNYFPKLGSLKLATKQKLSQEDVDGVGSGLATFKSLKHLTLVGFYWHQNNLLSGIFSQARNLHKIELPSIPGVKNTELLELLQCQQELKSLTINIGSLSSYKLEKINFQHLASLSIIESSHVSGGKLKHFKNCKNLTSMNINLSNCDRNEVFGFFSGGLSLRDLVVLNCKFSDLLIRHVVSSCKDLKRITWSNPKEKAGEMSDVGLGEIVRRCSKLEWLDIKSRGLTKLHYRGLADRRLNYVRINGMRVPGCV